MKKNILSEVLTQDWCAYCGAKEHQYMVRGIEEEASQPIFFCEECFDDLRQPSRKMQCAFCGLFAEYGVWKAKRWNTYASIDTQEITHVPHRRVLCGEHFEELLEEVRSRPRQSQLKDY